MVIVHNQWTMGSIVFQIRTQSCESLPGSNGARPAGLAMYIESHSRNDWSICKESQNLKDSSQPSTEGGCDFECNW